MQGYFGRERGPVSGPGRRYRWLYTGRGTCWAGGGIPHSTLKPFDPPQKVLDQFITLPELFLKVLHGWFAHLRSRGRFGRQDYGRSSQQNPQAPTLQPARHDKKLHRIPPELSTRYWSMTNSLGFGSILLTGRIPSARSTAKPT